MPVVSPMEAGGRKGQPADFRIRQHHGGRNGDNHWRAHRTVLDQHRSLRPIAVRSIWIIQRGRNRDSGENLVRAGDRLDETDEKKVRASSASSGRRNRPAVGTEKSRRV